MPSEKNLNAVFTDIANAIREKKGTADQMQPINMAEEIANIPQGGSLKTLLDTTKSAFYLISSYHGTSVDGLISYSDTENVINFGYMFLGCNNITTVPLLNTSKATNMTNMFANCAKLTEIPALDASQCTVTGHLDYMFSGCSSLKKVHMTGIKLSLDISSSTKFEKTDLLEIINNLETVSYPRKLKMGPTNLAKLTDEEKAIATNKGWTLE